MVSLWLFLDPLFDPGQALHRLLESTHSGEPLNHSATVGMSHEEAEGEGQGEVCIRQLQEGTQQAVQ